VHRHAPLSIRQDGEGLGVGSSQAQEKYACSYGTTALPAPGTPGLVGGGRCPGLGTPVFDTLTSHAYDRPALGRRAGKDGSMGTIRVYDPTAPSSARGASLAPRPATLRGTVAGILDNGKANAGLLMSAVIEELKSSHGVRDVVVHKKPVAGPASPQVIADLKASCDFVLVGSAD
jgi:hypothetical protein